MTVQSTDRKAGPFFSGTILPFEFKVFSKEDIQVIWTSAAGVESILVLDSEYSVTLNPDQDNTPGGSVTLNTAISGGANTVIIGDLAYDQGTDVRNQGGFEPEIIEDALDRVTILVQQLLEMAKRTLRIPASSSSSISTQLPQPTAGNVLGWNGEANQLVNLSPQDIATTVAFGTAFVDQFEGDGVETEFALSANPALLANMDVQVDGASLRNGIDFVLLAGAVIKFTTAPAAPAVPGELNIQVRGTVAVPQGFDTADVVVTQLPESGLWTTVQGFINRIVSSAGASVIGFIQAGIGAVVRTVQDKLRERVSVFDFMPPEQIADIQSGLATLDVTDSIQAALKYAYDLATASPRTDGWRKNTPIIELPRGRFRIAQANKLFATLTFYNGKIVGAGKRGGTEIIYDVPAATATDYLIYNNNLFGFVQFEGIRFSSANEIANQNFMYYSSAGTAQNFSFRDCEFEKFSLNFDVQGAANASENTFINCTFRRFSDASFRLNNQQAVNWRFYGCDAESFSGTLFEFLKGCNFIWSGGSIIPSASTARILKIPAGADSNAFGSSNSPNAFFQSCRFEMRNGSLMTEKINPNVTFSVGYDFCGMGGLNITDPTLYKMFTWAGAGKISITNCDNLNNYRFGHTVDNATARELFVSIKSSTLPPEVISLSTFVITGSAINGGYSPLFSVEDCGSRVDGVYRIRDSQYMNNTLYSRRGISKQKRGVSFTPDAGRMTVSPSGASFDLYIPPTRVIEVAVYPVANAGYGTISATIRVTNAAGTVTLATLNYIMGPAAPVIVKADCNYFVDTLAGDYLKVIFEHSSGATNLVFNGQLYLTY